MEMSSSRGGLVALILAVCGVAVTEGYDSCFRSQGGRSRLTGLNSSYIGFVQVCKDGKWTPISFEDEEEWTRKNSIVACKELGFLAAIGLMALQGFSGEAQHSSSTGGGGSSSLSPQQYYSVECTGLEERLVDCTWTIKSVKSQKKDAMVFCREDPSDGELSVVGISGADNEGMVIMYTPLKTYQWSTICSTEWDDKDAQVACRQLGYNGGCSQTYSSEDEVRSSYLPRKRYSFFECVGSEERLMDCQHTGPYPYQCSSPLYAGVVCTTEEEDDTVLNLNITLLAFMILISLLLIIILSLLLKCTLKRFTKKRSSPRSSSVAGEGEEGVGRTSISQQTVLRTRLDHDMPYALLSTIAPPSYEDTLLADQVVQQSEIILTSRSEQRQEQSEAASDEDSRSNVSTVNLLLPEGSHHPSQSSGDGPLGVA